MDTTTLLNVALVVGFIVLGGVFAATEIALVSLRDSQLASLEKTGARGARVARVARDPNRFLAAVQIGVTVAGFFSAAYGGATLAPDVAPLLERLGLSESAAASVALVVLTLAIAYLSLVLGELVPKRLALQRSATVALAVTPALDRFSIVMRPIIWLLSVSTNALVRLLGGNPDATTESLSEEELRQLVSTHDALEEQERRILGDVLSATEMPVRRVMRPRSDVAFLRGSDSLGDAARQAQSMPYSRFPVTGKDVDDVIGFLHVRDLLGVARDDRRRVRDIVRDILVLPLTSLVLPSVSRMQQEGTHIALVVDEYGGTAGIVTLEDLVEELVGEIRDEYDAHQPHERFDEPSRVPGQLPVHDFVESTGIDLPDGAYDTIAGYVIAALGRIPTIGDTVDLPGYEIEVTAMDGRRVESLALRPREDIDDEDDPDAVQAAGEATDADEPSAQ